MIRIHELIKEYDGHRAVNSLSLSVEPGEIVGLVGPNGAGKTSTLRCLAGIIPLTGGAIEICGHDIVNDAVAARQHLAFVPDEPHLFDYLTVRDHMALFARLYGVENAAERAEQLLTESALWDRKDDFPGELSRGMKQKLILSCALLHDPKVLILDEPLTGLDPAAMRRVKKTVVATAEAGTSVLVSSHMLHLVEEICGRIIIIQQGEKAVEGSLDSIRAALPGLEGDANLEEIFLKATGLDEES
ncbi:MAG: ATP-binding cassette domain-containing protein [Acidobacteria bacterium]|nr:ATP-binding cassette domain-containing protein [Acidobacteriota bacterium]